MQPHIKNQQFLGLVQVLTNHPEPVDDPDVQEDIDDEQATMSNPAQQQDEDEDEKMDVHYSNSIASESDNSNKHLNHKIHNTTQKSPFGTLPSLWRETITHASKGVTDNTHREYIRLSNACSTFLVDQKLITHEKDFFSDKPLPYADEMIIAWIMNSCDTIGLDGKLSHGSQGTFAHAQKMRASITHMFGRILGLGSQSWKQESLPDGSIHTEGNPSIAEKVSTYMVGLRRRKVQNGKTTTSARAVTPQIMEALYDFNHRPENWNLSGGTDAARNKADIHQWGGPLHRRAAQAIYIIAFLCMLRVDEVLKIRVSHIEPDNDWKKVTLTLPFRKTHQFGEIKPFVLHTFPEEEAFLCPVRALSEWIKASRITSGYIFRRMSSDGRPSANDNPMTSEKFLEIFRNNLIDIGIEPSPYGTHSFRRGGCQYFASVRQWMLRQICDWGGWSTEFASLTIVKYLISWNDEPEEKREDFLDPNQQPTILCYHCGRSCRCA